MLVHSSCHVLEAIPFDGDYDNDGILNADEDTNGNGYLNDDDDDNDGTINYHDPQNLGILPNVLSELIIFPNPATNGNITFASDTNLQSLSIFNISGQQMEKMVLEGNRLSVNFSAGVYFLKFEYEGKLIVKKLIVK